MKVLILSLLISANTLASDPLSYTGRLANANGSPVTGPVDLKLDLAYTDNLTTNVCSTTMTAIPLSNGVFHLKIEYTFAECSSKTIPQVLAATPVGETVALRVTDLTHSKIYSFHAIHALPYASVATLSKNLVQMGAASGQVLAWNGTSWAPAASGGTGTVTSVATGAGLTGGPITGTGTISIVDGGVTSAKIDQMGAAVGNVLKWTAGGWAPSADSGLTSETDPNVQGYAKNTVPVCLANQTLKFDALLNAGAGGLFCITISIGSDAVAEGSTNLYFSDARAKSAAVANTITNGTTDVAPAQDAVFDALALKQNNLGSTSDVEVRSLGIGTATPGAKLGVVGTLSASSGVEYGMKLSPTVTQTSTAGYTGLLMDVTDSGSTGSGARKFVDFKVNGVSKFSIDTTGAMTSSTSSSGTTASYTSSSGSQLVVGYDGTNKTTMDVGATGFTTLSAAGTGAGFNLAGGPVGIGVTSPGEALDVAGSVRATTGVKAPLLSNTTDLSLTADSDANASGALILNTGTNERIRILNNGNVGIGTNAPAQLVDVRVPSLTNGGIYTGFGAPSAALSSGITLLGTNDQGYPRFTFNSPTASFGSTIGSFNSNSTALYPLRVHSSTFFVGPALTTSMSGTAEVYDATAVTGVTRFWVREGAGQSTSESFGVYSNDGTTPRLVVQNGKVGIGTTPPESKLTVDSGGTNGFTSGTLPPGMTIYGSPIDGHGAALTFKPATGNQGMAGIGSFRVSQYQTDLRFYTNNTVGANAFSERMRINQDGFIGIDTTAPTSKLTIYDPANTTSGQQLRIGSGPTFDYTMGRDPANGYLQFAGTQTGNIAYTFAGGPVGIGTTTPNARLDVAAPLAASSGTQYGMKLSPSVTQTGTAGYTGLLMDVTDTASTGSGLRKFVDFKVNGTSKFSIDSTGAMTSSVGTSGTTANYTSASGSQLVVGYDGTNKTTMDVGITGFTTLSAAGVGAGFNLSGGPVGVGVPFPGEALDVAGSIRASTSVKAPLLSNTTDLTLTADSDANASGALILNTGANERMRILNDGKVGIGTTTPTAKLQVNGPTASLVPLLVKTTDNGLTNNLVEFKDALGTNLFHVQTNGHTFYSSFISSSSLGINLSQDALRFSDTTAGADRSDITTDIGRGLNFKSGRYDGAGATAFTFNTGATLATAGAKLLSLKNNGSEKLTVDYAGNVGIGTTNPSEKLDVSGDAQFGANDWLSVKDTGGGNGRLVMGVIGSVDFGGALLFRNNAGTTEHMRIESSGKVGIGTTTPNARLDVAAPLAASSGTEYGMKLSPTVTQTGTAGYTGLLMDVTDSASTGSGLRKFVDFKVNGTSKFSIDSTGAMTSSVGTSGTTANYTSASGSQLVVGYDGTNKTTMDVGITGFTTLSAAGVGAGFNLSGGPVGVGVPFPGEALDVAGSIRSSTSVKAPLLSNTTDLTLTADSDANASGALILNTGTNERMRILNNGNVGIGTTAPTTGKLSIYHQVDPGTTPAALSIVTPGMPGGTATAQYGIKVDGVSYNSSTVMYGVYSKAKGNIGQTSYGVYGETEGAAIQNTYGVYGKGFQSDTNGAGISYGVYGTVTSAGLNGTGKTYAGYFDNQATTGNTSVGLYVNSAGGATNNYSAILMGGNVGIGTINPTSPLKVNGRIAVGRQGIVSGSYNPGEVVGIWSIGEGYQVDTTANTFGNHYGLVYAHSDSTRSITGWGHQILGVQNGTMTFALSTTAGNAHFSGNVGIGTTSPSVKLDVVGGISIQNNNNLTWGGTYGAGIPTIASTVGDGIYFYPTGSTSGATVSMKGSGNVGIGTAAPLEKLSVVGNIVVSNANSFGWGNRTTQIIGEDNTTGGNGMRFDTNGVEKMRLDVSGNLGVGISSPTAKLDVAGIIQSNTGSNAGEYRIGGTSVLSATSGATLLINSGGFTTVDIAGRVGFPTASATHKILVTGTAGLSTGTAWTNTSDIRLKDVHGNYEYGLEEILKLNTVRFNYKKDNAMDLPSDVPMIGFVAQEVKKVIPDAVTENGSGYLELNVDPIHWAVVNAIKELYSKLMGHDEDITILKKQVQRLPALEKENLELKQENAKKAKEMAAIKAYLCSKDPKAAICNL